jgi:hypothetical protein
LAFLVISCRAIAAVAVRNLGSFMSRDADDTARPGTRRSAPFARTDSHVQTASRAAKNSSRGVAPFQMANKQFWNI